jgi:hypothetical protein
MLNHQQLLCKSFPFAANIRKFAIFVSSKQTEIAVFHLFRFLFTEFQKHEDVDMETWRFRHENMEIKT